MVNREWLSGEEGQTIPHLTAILQILYPIGLLSYLIVLLVRIFKKVIIVILLSE